MKTTRWVILGNAVAALVSGTPALAETVDSESPAPMKLEEIVVTATRREESLEKVPISVSAYTQEMLDKQQVKDFSDIARLTPGVTITPQMAGGNTSGASVSIRGISSTGVGAATVGVYIDDSPVQIRPDSLSSVNPYPKIFDLERVEILRGPQGTLFGAGSEGGTIRFITPDPSLTHYNSYIRSDLSYTEGGATSYETGAAGGGPIVEDTLGFRVSAWYRHDGGYIDRISWVNQQLLSSNSNWSDSSVLRGALRWQPYAGLDINASLYYQRTNDNDSSNFWEGYSNPARNHFVNGNPLRTPTQDRFTLPALRVKWDLGGVTLISNTSYLDRHNDNIFDDTTLSMSTFAGVGPITPPAPLQNIYTKGFLADAQNVFTQEVRLQSTTADSHFTWVVGAFYQHQRQNAANNIIAPFLDELIAYPNPPSFHVPQYLNQWFLYAVQSSLDEEKSGFGQVDFKPVDKLTLTAGVRVANHKYGLDQFAAGPVVGTNVGIAGTASQSGTPVTPKFGVSFQATANDMVYASAAKGYRQGSTTAPTPTNCQPDLTSLGISGDARTIAPDTVWSYEVGAKDRLFHGTLQFDTSVYQINWKRIQSQITLPTCGVPLALNLGDATSKGFDFLTNWLATEHLSLAISVGYTDARYTTTATGSGGKIIRSAGQPLDVSPWKGVVSGQYDFVLFDRPTYVRIDEQVQSHDPTPPDVTAATDPTIPRAPSYNDLLARAGVKLGNWDLSLYGANLLNEHPELGRYRDATNSPNYRGLTVAPLTIGFTGVFRY